MIAMAFPTPNGLRTEWPRRLENPSSSGRWRRPGFLDFGYPWQEAGTLGCCHTGYRVGDWHPSTDANCDHSSSICTRGKSIQRNRACLPAGCRGFVIIRISENVRSGCGACLASFGSVPRETVLYNSAYFPEQIRHAVGIVFTISLLGLAMELLQPLVGRTTGSEQIHDGFGGLLVSVGDAKARAQSRKCSRIRRMVCRSAISAMTPIGPAHFGRTASLLDTLARRDCGWPPAHRVSTLAAGAAKIPSVSRTFGSLRDHRKNVAVPIKI